MAARLSTGNEYISIPEISASRAGVETAGFLHYGFRACIELHGSEACPLVSPIIEVDGHVSDGPSFDASVASYWVPEFTAVCGPVSARVTYFAPLDRRGFVGVLRLTNTGESDIRVRAGWQGCWERTFHTANLRKLMAGAKYANITSWHPGVPVIEYRGHTPLFGVAFLTEDVMPARISGGKSQQELPEWADESLSATPGVPLFYEIADVYSIAPGEVITIPVYVGFGLDEVSSVSSARDLRLHGHERLLSHLTIWLDNRTIDCADDYLKRVMNTNSFYNYFYAQGTTLDTEEMMLVCARSSRSDSCAAYRDHDAMLWSLPAVLQVNWAQARRMLIYTFTRQLANVGLHSRFIDGIVLEPGLQLDQLCAPIYALRFYVQLTGDMSLLFDRRVQMGVNTIQQILAAQRHPDVALFETLLLPSGDPSKYPYVCYSNVLVWRILHDVAWLYERIRDIDRSEEASRLSAQVREAILERLVVRGPYGDMFALSVDMDGNYELGDDPAGSLQLLSHYEFCPPDDPIYRNTVAWIHSEHNPLSGMGKTFGAAQALACRGPSLLGIINDLLTDRKDSALKFLRNARLDEGIACEIVDPETGDLAGGPAYASCAGFLAYALSIALGAIPPEMAVERPKRRPSETLYEPPPDTTQDIRKARL